MKNRIISKGLFLSGLLYSGLAMAEPAKPAAAASTPAVAADADKSPESGEAVDVSKIQEKYWAQGKESELGVVQNRKYTLANKFELGMFAGNLSSDPFLSVHHFGLSLGYHFNSLFSLHAIGWKAAVGASQALKTLEATPGAVSPNTNLPKSFFGLEGDLNLLYGKVSLLGKMIIYVDLFLLGGVGSTSTETGNYVTPFLGLGQKIHLNQYLAIHLDYRIMRYNETIKSKTPATYGNVVGERVNTTDAITLGLDFTY